MYHSPKGSYLFGSMQIRLDGKEYWADDVSIKHWLARDNKYLYHIQHIFRFYIQPLAHLQHKTAKLRRNIATGEIEMSFNVLMWSEEAKEVVYRHLVREGKADGKLQRHAIIVVKKQVSYHSPHWLINSIYVFPVNGFTQTQHEGTQNSWMSEYGNSN